jgi:hypothetical protein
LNEKYVFNRTDEMKLYKFKSLRNFQYVADIFCNKRFHTALFTELNDPMEGLFEYDPETSERYINQIKQEKGNLRTCSFSKNFKNLLLWAHYADGFKGICIEIEANDSSQNELVEVTYSSSFININEHNANQDRIKPPRPVLIQTAAAVYAAQK